MAAGGFNPGLIPGANSGGSNVGVPSAGSPSTATLGGGNNPLLPTFSAGQNVPAPTNPAAAAPMGATGASGQPNDPGSLLAGLNPAQSFGLGQGDPNSATTAHNFVKAMRKAGFSAGVAGQLWNFINSGAGFNPQVAQSLIAAMQPGIKKGEADILENFSTQGARDSSGAQYGLSNYLSNVQLNEGQIWSQLYEQSVQNYMNVLMGGKGPAPQNMFQNVIQWMNAAANVTAAAAGFSHGSSGGGKAGGEV